jgi:hydroxypyruvate reductase/glycerate 2-kinase
MNEILRRHAREIWQAAVDAVRPEPLVRDALADGALGIGHAVRAARRIIVLGAGKASAAMAAAVEDALADVLDRVQGFVNVPDEAVRPLRKIRLHAARPAGSNQPTAEGVAGAEQMLRLARTAGPDDVALCLFSGGGSALSPAPAAGVTLADKQAVTKLLHACGATINQMNAVRKHLSAIKGGRLAEAFRGKALFSLIISDVIGDPLDVIASGPTVPDPTTFADVLALLDSLEIRRRVPPAAVTHLERGAAGEIPETPKRLPATVHNVILGNNVKALAASESCARGLGYAVLNLGSFIEGETSQVAIAVAGIAHSIREQGIPVRPPACVLIGGETTVTLGADHGLGGRNQEFVLAALLKLGAVSDVAILSGGTDGEDGPTDAAGAIAAGSEIPRVLWEKAPEYLQRHDAYHFFEAVGGLLKTGLTQTNVMDVRVVLIAEPRRGDAR